MSGAGAAVVAAGGVEMGARSAGAVPISTPQRMLDPQQVDDANCR